VDGEPGTDEATALPAADTADADAPEGTDAERDQVAGDEAGAGTDQPTPAELQEKIEALTNLVSEQETRHAAQLETARRETKEGDTDKLATLVELAHGAIDRPQQEAAAFQSNAEALKQGAASAFSYRVERLQPDKATEQRYMALFQSGRHAELDQELLDAEKKKWGAPSGAETSEAKRAEQQRIADARRGKGADLSGGKGGGGKGFKTKMEARTLHVQGKISNARMREINADLTIPEQ
jgi:hypothetical protein